MPSSKRTKHITPTLAAQVLFALERGKRVRQARAKLRKLYGPNGRRVEGIIMGEAA